LKALEFSLSHNAYSNQNQFMQFNFNQQGKKLFTPLHFAVLKSNHEAFIYLMRYALKYIDLLALDELLRTARGLALINSPFFKLLVRLEK
jgi:ankyrin repeat protein